MEEADDDLLHYAEQLLAGVLGAASARVATGSIVREKRLRLDEVMDVLDEAQQVIAYSRELESRRRELQRTSRELRAANDELREVDRRKDEFVSTVSHELQTPLAAIRANAELLRTHPTLDARQRRAFLDLILQEARRLSRLVDQVLDLERLDADAAPADEPVDLDSLVAAAAEAVRPSMTENDVHLHIGTRDTGQSAGLGAFVCGHRDRLLQVLLNVLSNAAKYATRRATLSVRAGERFVDVRISDDGPGIHPDDRSIIFDRFRQGRARGPQPGSGLGLAIARQIVRQHGGAITVESRRGEGATFQIRLPREGETGETETGGENASPDRDGRGRPSPSPESAASPSTRSSSSAGPGP
jgi:signal transduction histidine kinase